MGVCEIPALGATATQAAGTNDVWSSEDPARDSTRTAYLVQTGQTTASRCRSMSDDTPFYVPSRKPIIQRREPRPRGHLWTARQDTAAVASSKTSAISAMKCS